MRLGKLILVIVLVLLAALVILFVIGSILKSDTASSPNLGEEISSQVNNSTQTELERRVAEADKIFWVERDYNDAANQLDLILKETKMSAEDRVWMQLRLATALARTETESGVALFVDIYNNESTTQEQKARALESVASAFASNLGENGFTLELLNAQFSRISDEKIVIENGSITSETEGHFYLRKVFERTFELNESYVAAAFVALQTVITNPDDFINDPERIMFARDHADLAESLIFPAMELASEDLNKYEERTLNAAHVLLKYNYELYQVGLVSRRDFDRLADDMLEYTDKQRGLSFSAGITAADTTLRKAIVLALAVQLSPDDIPQEEREDWKLRFERNIYSLSDEDIKSVDFVRKYGGSTENFSPQELKQREAVKFIASVVDPRLKDFLINRVGVWNEEDFE